MSSRTYFKFICALARAFYPKARTVFEAPPDGEAGVFVCNHSTIIGPVMMTLDFERPHRNWVIGCAMDKNHCESYAFHDVFSGNSRKCKWFFRFLAKLVKLLLPPILENVDAVPVFHDRRIIETFRKSAESLIEGRDIVIFGESPRRYSEYVNELQRGFVDIGRLYYRQTGKKLKYYPVYVERKNRVIAIGAPIEYDPELTQKEQRERVCKYLEEGIDRQARALPEHKPVKFLEQRWYDAYGRYVDDFEGYWRMVEEWPGGETEAAE
ncbi:MAG: hypothetical protein K6G56_04205 [Clostridiales bacterium]|nr:hypothetical protein [Clostridiales bacterium]